MDPRILARFGLVVTGESVFAADFKGHQYLIRPLSGPGEFAACMRLQAETWAMADAEVVPENVLVALRDCHLPAFGAFDANGLMLATLFGFGGVDVTSHQPILHSHMLAVVADLRGYGIGTTMKITQAWMCSQLGINVIEWTVDPLRSNWALNSGVLGGVTKSYRQALYTFTGSGIYHGFPADRVLIHWDTDSRWVESRMLGERPKVSVVVANACPLVETEHTLTSIFPDGPNRVRLEIPPDIDRLEPEARLAERMRTRPIFERLFESGYVAVDFVHDSETGRNFVIFERDFVLR